MPLVTKQRRIGLEVEAPMANSGNTMQYVCKHSRDLTSSFFGFLAEADQSFFGSLAFVRALLARRSAAEFTDLKKPR